MIRACLPPALLAHAAFLLGALVPAASGATLYGVTATDLVTVNVSSGATTLVGSLGLSGLQTAGPLAWHTADQSLYGLIYDYTPGPGGLPVVTGQRLARIEVGSGAWTTVADLGNPASGPTFDALEYFDHLGSLVISRSSGAGQTGTSFLETISTSGARSALVTTGIDNDLLAYDAARSLAYSTDPNGLQEVRRLNLETGGHSALSGGLPSATTGELAFDLASDRLYALDYTVLPSPNRSLYTLDTAAGDGPVTFGTATVTDVQLRGIAFAPVPEPATSAGLAGALLLLWLGLRRYGMPPDATL